MASERSTVLNALNALDTLTLQKLLAAKDFLFNPDKDVLTRVTFADMIDKAHELADIHFPEWTDRSKADFGEFLVEIFALFSWKDFSYMNMFNKESMQRRAVSYVHVALHAIRLGYIPGQQKSSSSTMNVTFQGLPSGITYPAGSFEVMYAATSLVFTNAAPVVVAAGTSTIAVPMKSGRYVSTTGAFNGKSIRVQATKVDPESVLVQVDGVDWQKVNSFATYDNTGLVYMVLPSEGNEFEVVFGMGGYGQRPGLQKPYTVSYRLDNVDEKNVVAATVAVVKNVPNSYITGVVMPNPSVDGGFPESIESIRENSSMLFRTYGASVVRVPQDAITILQADPTVRKATAFSFANILYFAVIPADGNPADQPFLDNLADTLIDAKLLMGYTVAGSLTSYVTITGITAKAYAYNDFEVADIENQIKDYLTFITSPLEGAAYGVGLDLGKTVQELKEKIPGLYNFVFETVNGAAADNIELTALQIFNAIDLNDVTIDVIRTI